MKNLAPLPFTAVALTEGFWKSRQEVNRKTTLPAEYRQCDETGRLAALDLAWKPGAPNKPHPFWDSDTAKWLEAASYSLATHPDAAMEGLVDGVIRRLEKAQMEDGYLNSFFQNVAPEKRWTNLRDQHELYCAGHLMEAAVAHFRATGKETLLGVMRRFADHIDRVFGPKPGQKRGYCGHEEIELALVKLHGATGEKRYLDLAKFFVDERGRRPHYFEEEAKALGEDPGARHRSHEREPFGYYQAGRPVRDLMRVEGHAVRAMYLYCAMADLAREVGDRALLAACVRLWRHATEKNLYLTGGIGSSKANEGFTFDYDLPNETAYAETCANIGLTFWAHRMFALTGGGSYLDVMERALYNGVASGVSLDGRHFFYDNKLAALGGGRDQHVDGAAGKHHRRDWFGCSCCPPNVARLFASLGGYLYASGKDGLYVNLYADSRALFAEQGVLLTQKTRYPWDGEVTLEISFPKSGGQTKGPSFRAFKLHLRIPGWCRSFSVKVNGKKAPGPKPVDGFIALERPWKTGDRVTLDLAMPVERVYCHPSVRQNLGRVALQRGPVVYCLEEVDHKAPVQNLSIPDTGKLRAAWKPKLLGGIVVIQGPARFTSADTWGKGLYQPNAPKTHPTTFTAIPYCVWDNRKKGGMTVWIERG